MNTQGTTQNEKLAIPVLVAKKPTILDLCTQYRFDPNALAFISDVKEEVVHALFAYLPVSKIEAKKVLTVLSDLLRQQYTLENTDIPFIEDVDVEGKEEHEQTQIS